MSLKKIFQIRVKFFGDSFSLLPYTKYFTRVSKGYHPIFKVKQYLDKYHFMCDIYLKGFNTILKRKQNIISIFILKKYLKSGNHDCFISIVTRPFYNLFNNFTSAMANI